MLKKRESGSITIEATIALTIFMIFFLAIIGIGQYFAVQQAVKHSVNQTALSISADNRRRQSLGNYKTVSGITDIVKAFDSANGTNELDKYTEVQTYTDLWKTTDDNHTFTKDHAVPDLTGKSYKDAYAVLRNLHFGVSFKTSDYDLKYNNAKENTIVKQNPAPGVEMSEGSVITLTVATDNKDFKYHPDDKNDAGRVYVKNKVASMFTYYMTGTLIDPNSSGFDAAVEKALKKKRIYNVSFDNTQISKNDITVRVEYKMDMGFSFYSFMSSDDAVFTDCFTIKLQKE